MTTRTDATPLPTDLESAQALIAALQGRVARLEDERRYGIVYDTSHIEPALAELDRSYPVLVPRPAASVGERGTALTLIEGENLHALHALRATMPEAVDLIYIDPPYNTGRSDFRYNDDYVGTDDPFRHSKWLSFMDRRLSVAFELLRDGGMLAASIDDNEQAQLKLLLEKHFGDGNVKTIVVKMSEASGVKMAAARKSGSIPKLKEYLLVACKNAPVRMRIAPVAKEKWDVAYSLYLEGLSRELREQVAELAARGAVTPAELLTVEAALANVVVRPLAAVEKEQGVTAALRNDWRLDNAWRIVQFARSDSIRGLLEARTDTPDQALLAVASKRDGKLYLARSDSQRQLLFADDNLTTHPGDLWLNVRTTGIAGEGGVTFKNGKKPLALLDQVIASCAGTDATVLDFFAGSGSTAEAVARLNARDGGNRRCIVVTNNDGNICREVTYPRLAGILTGELANGKTAAPLEGRLGVLDLELRPREHSAAEVARDALASAQSGFITVRVGATSWRPVADSTLLVAGDRAHLVLSSGSYRAARRAAAGLAAEGIDLNQLTVWVPGEAALPVDLEIAALFTGATVRAADFGLRMALTAPAR